MKKLFALILALIIFISPTVSAFATTPESSNTDIPSDNETSQPPATDLTNPPFTIEGYTIPKEPDIIWNAKNLISYNSEEGNTIDLLSSVDESGNTIVSRAYCDETLIQKTVFDTSALLMYTEVYSLEEESKDEPVITDRNGYVSIIVQKAISTEKLDELFNGTPIKRVPVKTSFQEPLFDSDLPAANYGDGYRLVESGGGYDYAPSIYAVITRRRVKSEDLGLTKHWKFSAATPIGEVLSSFMFAGLSGNPAAVFVSLIEVTKNQLVAYDQAVEYQTYRYTYDYRIRIKQAANNIYYNPQRVFDYWRFFNSTTGKEEYEEKEFLGGFVLNNTEMLKYGISNYLDYHFYDIINHWGKDHIKWAYNKGYLSGTSTYAFSPNTVASRGMAITALYKMAGSPSVSTTTSFTDVPSTAYYAKAVSWGVKNSIVSGTSLTTFSPNDNLTREQFVVMLYKYAKYNSKNVNVTADLSQFRDSSSVSSWAKTAMQWAVGKGIVSGDDGYLNPTQAMKRVELCALMHNYSDRA